MRKIEVDQVQEAATEELKFWNKKQESDKVKKQLQMQPEQANNKTTK